MSTVAPLISQLPHLLDTIGHKHMWSLECSNSGRVRLEEGRRVSNEPDTTATLPSMRILLQQMKGSWDIYIINEGKARIRSPGLTLYDMDKYGLPRFEKIVRLMIMTGFAFHQPIDSSGNTFHGFSELHKEHTYGVSMHGMATKMLYDETVRKYPLDITYELNHVGKRSWTSQSSLFNAEGTYLAKMLMRHVYIDRKTWLPQELPTWWTDKYSKYAIHSQPELVVKPMTRPTTAASGYSHVVSWTDIDFYDHTNFSVYINMCVDAVHHFVSKGLYPSLSGGALRRGIESMECLFLGETYFNDTLEVHSWESDSRTVRFDITRNHQSIFQLMFVFFEE